MLARRRPPPLAAFAPTLARAFAVVATLACGLVAATPAAIAADCPGADLVPSAASIQTARAATLCLLNEQRAAAGIGPLAERSQLDDVATAHSEAMVAQRFFDHVSPSGEGLEQRLATYLAAASVWAAAENLAWGDGPRASPARIVDTWMRSDVHRPNILAAGYREIGIGIAIGSPRGSVPSSATYTADFVLRETSQQQPPPPPQSASVQPPPSAPVASAALAPPYATATPQATPPKRVSAAKKRRIKAQCVRIARRTRGSRATRKARVARCVRARLRAAAR